MAVKKEANDDQQEIGVYDELVEKCKAKGISLYALCIEVEIRPQVINKWNGNTPTSIKHLRKLEAALEAK